MVIAQPHLSLTPNAPFRCLDIRRPAQLAMIDRTLTLARQATHGAGKTHFTIFPEYSIPGLEGIARIEEALEQAEWPNETIVIGGVDALTKNEFATLVDTAHTHYDSEKND